MPRGRKDRTLVVVDVRRTPTAEEADCFLQVRPGGDYDLLAALRARLKGRTLDCIEVASIPVKELDSLLERMKRCRYGIVFYGTGLSMSRGWEQNILELLLLVRDLNAFTRFFVMAMRGPLGFGNVAGSRVPRNAKVRPTVAAKLASRRSATGLVSRDLISPSAARRRRDGRPGQRLASRSGRPSDARPSGGS
jgi:hypothetical protein